MASEKEMNDKKVFLVCKETARMASGARKGRICFKQGKAYEVTDASNHQYTVIDEMGDQHYISVGYVFLEKHFIVTVEV